jgi:peptidoglycan hydrolase-like protein with peptidoglycan-binding domain
MQQGYTPPKQQNDGTRNRRAQKHVQSAITSTNQPGKQNIWFLLILTVIVLVIVIGGSVSLISHNTGNINTKASSAINKQMEVGDQDIPTESPVKTTTTLSTTMKPTTTPTATRATYKTLMQGSQGDEVKQMQSRLIQLGYLNDIADGVFGEKTREAVETFQNQNYFISTGIADDETLLCLYSYYAIEYSPPQYGAGMYKIGYDIDPGEYIILANSSYSAYFCLSSDSNGNDIIANENFDYNSIITVKSGEYLEISRSRMMLLSDFSEHYTIPKDVSGVMYKVGTNLKAGEYKLVTTSDFGGYYCIYASSRQDDIIANDNFENRAYVTVKKGQYLVLNRCRIAFK